MDDLTNELAGPRQLKKLGSPAWCIQTVHYLKDHIRHVDEQWRQADQILDELIAVRAWEVIPPGEPYGSLDNMLHAHTGLYAREIRSRIRQAQLAAHGGDRKSAEYQGRNPTLITSSGERGATYAVRRLRRERPDLAERVDRGEVSANKAAIEAGFGEKRISIPVGHPERIAAYLRKHMPDAIPRLIELLTSDGDGR